MQQEKNSHSPLERPKLRNAGGPELLGLYARDAQVKSYLEQQNWWELITAEHKVLKIVGRNLAAWRSVMKQNFLGPIRKPKSHSHKQFLGVWQKSVKLTIELLKSKSTPPIRLVRGRRSLERNSYGSSPWARGQNRRVRIPRHEAQREREVTKPKTADGQLKFIGGNQVLRTPTLTRYHPSSRRSSRKPSWRIRRVSTNHQSKK